MADPDVREPFLVLNHEDYRDLLDAIQHQDSRIAAKAVTPIGDRAQERHEDRLKDILGEETFEEAAGITPKVDIDPEAEEPHLEWRAPDA